MPKRAFIFCVYLPLLASHICFEQSRPQSRAKLQQITTLWWSGRLTSIITGDGAAAAGLPTPEQVAHDPTVCQNQTYLGHDALRQAYLPIREGGLGLTSSSSIKGTAYIGCHALVLGRVVAASARGNLPSLLERLPERPMASALIEELKIVATEAERSQIEDAVGSSWAALAAEEDPQWRGI